MQDKVKGLSSSTLKIIAVITMIIDHFGAAIYENVPGFSIELYYGIRLVGRVAFPIYCFLLVEGFFLTRNIYKYIARCFVFALVSEIPFDMAFRGDYFEWNYQNVFFTLGLGLCTIYIMSLVDKRVNNVILGWVIKLAFLAVFGVLGEYAKCDYGFIGVAVIVFFYLMKIRNLSPLRKYIGGSLVFYFVECINMTQAFMKREYWLLVVLSIIIFPITFAFIHFYNGQRGMKLKYFFYLVYPVHLLIYGIIRMFVM